MMGIIKAILFLIISPIIGFFLTMILAMSFEAFTQGNTPLYFFAISSILLFVLLNLQFNRGAKKEKYVVSSWGPPEDIRDRVISTPQFVGRFDRSRGLLEATARGIQSDSAAYESMSRPDQAKIIRLRGELLDQNGSPLEYVQVEIKGQNVDWVGNIAEGDRIRVEGNFEDDGILHTRRAFNFSTNSWVGERRK